MNQTHNNSNSENNDSYDGKTDHEVILILEAQVQDLIQNLDKSQRQNTSLMKTQGQISVVRLVFLGVLILVGGFM